MFLCKFEASQKGVQRLRLCNERRNELLTTVHKKIPWYSNSGMGNGTGIPGPGTWTDALGTNWTGTNIVGTVPGQKSLGQPNAKLWDKLGL